MKPPRLILFAVALMIAPVAHSMATQRGVSRADPPPPPPGWRETLRSTLDLTLAGKHDEVIAIYEKWVAKYPDFGDAHSMLCGAYEAKARDLMVKRVPNAGSLAPKLLEQAAVHGRRAFELGNDPRTAIRGLIDIYGPLGLNRPDEQERVIREAVKRYPAEPLAHSEFISLLISKGEKIDTALQAARTVIPIAGKARLEYADLLLGEAQRVPEPYRTTLLGEVERLTAEAKRLPELMD
jgi:tetratricopeptide (TPR) repeat protein